MPDSWLRRLGFSSVSGGGPRRGESTGQHNHARSEERSAMPVSSSDGENQNLSPWAVCSLHTEAGTSGPAWRQPHSKARSRTVASTSKEAAKPWWQRSRRSAHIRVRDGSESRRNPAHSATSFEASNSLGKARQEDRPFAYAGGEASRPSWLDRSRVEDLQQQPGSTLNSLRRAFARDDAFGKAAAERRGIASPRETRLSARQDPDTRRTSSSHIKGRAANILAAPFQFRTGSKASSAGTMGSGSGSGILFRKRASIRREDIISKGPRRTFSPNAFSHAQKKLESIQFDAAGGGVHPNDRFLTSHFPERAIWREQQERQLDKSAADGCASRAVNHDSLTEDAFPYDPIGSFQDPKARRPIDTSTIRNLGQAQDDSSASPSFDIYQPHPFGVWHRNQDQPTSLPPPPPRRSVSTYFAQQTPGLKRPPNGHTRNAHSLGTLPDLSSLNVASSSSHQGTQRRSLGLAQVRAAGFPFIMPDSASEGTRTPATELASDVGSLRRFNAPSEAGSASMSRTFSDQPSTRSYEESSVSAKGPSATITPSAAEYMGSSSLREHQVSRSSAYSAPSEPVPSSSHHHDDLASIVEHPASNEAHIDHGASAGSDRDNETGPEAEQAPLPPFSHSNASIESASSPIMKMQPPTLATPPLRDFPAKADQNAGSDPSNAPLRQRTDSRPAVSPTGTSRAISAPAPPMPVPQALQDNRPSVRRAEGQRAESEVVHSRSSSKPFKFPARSSAQFPPRERASVLSTGEPPSRNPETLIRRLIRRASVKSNKSQSTGGAPSLVLSPSKTSVALPDELGMQEDTNTSMPRAESLYSFRGRPYELKPQTLTQRRAKSKEAGPSKIPRSSSIFASFRPRRKRQESLDHLGSLRRDEGSAFPRDGLPLSSSSPFLARDPDFAGFQPSSDDEVRSRDFVIISRKPPTTASVDQQEATEMLKSPEMAQQQDLDDRADVDSSREDRPLSHMTHQTDHSVGTGTTPSHGDEEPSATPEHTFDAVDEDVEPSSHSRATASSAGHSKASDGHHARPRPGIPRIWQGLEPMDADYSMRSTHIDDVDSSDDDDTPPEHSLPANRFDTATTTSSFRTAASHFDSPKSTAARRLASGSKASRVSLRTLDTPLARHFDQGPRQGSPLSDLITNLERRLSARSTSGAMRSTPYHHPSVASPSSELLHQDSELTHRATTEDPSPSPSMTGHHDGQHYDFLDQDDDDDASLRAHPHETHLPAASHTALVETLDKSNRNSLLAPSPQTSQETSDGANGEQIRSKRDTFGGLDSMPLAPMDDARQDEYRVHQTRPQLSRFSTATAGPEEDDLLPLGHLNGEMSEDREEVIVPEVKVTEIESHLAAVEAALQDNRDEGSFDVTSLRQRMSNTSYGMHANASSTSVLSRDGLLPPLSHAANESADELSLPGAWVQDDSSFATSDDGRRITLAPESHEALADAVRSVRRAISSSQLTDKDDSGTALAHRSVDTLEMESFVSEAADADNERRPAAGDVSVLSEATPARAAKRRQEGMRDIEEAYSRMLALVQSSAIGVTPSPQMRGDDGRLGFEPPRRPMKHGQAASTSVHEPVQNSPLAKASTKTEEPLSQTVPSTRSTLDPSGGFSQPAARIPTRTHPAADTRTSTSLSGLMGIPVDTNPHMLRQSSVSTVASALDEAPAEAAAFRRRPLSDAKSSSSRYSQLLGRDPIASSLVDFDGSHKRFSTDNTTVGRASSGAGHTSPSATAKTLGTPRSLNTSASQHSIAHLLRRHELEKESLLDTLEIVRSENSAMHARYDRLTSDLHAEVTRVLELERELERRDSREVTLIDQIQNLESELMELRYLDFQLNSTADQTLGSEDGEGSIMDVELPPSLRSRAGVPSNPFSPRGTANPMVSPPPSFSSASISALLKPTHRSTRSEAFAAGLPGSERATLPTSRSEMLRARPVSLLNGPGGLFRDERGSQRSSQASPLPTPRSSSLLRHPHRDANKPTQARQASPSLLGLSLPKDDSDIWNIPDEQLPEIEDEILPTPLKRPHEQAPMLSSAGADTIDSRLGDNGHFDDGYERRNEIEEDRLGSVPSTIQPSVLSNGVTPQRVVSSSLPRSTSQATVTKSSTLSQLPRPAAASKIPTSRSVSGSSDSQTHRSVSSRLPRLGLKPSSRYTATTASGSRTVSNATDKSTGSTLSSVYSTLSAGAPPSLGSLPSGNNTMEDEIQAELARLGNPKPFMRYYSPPRSKMI